MLNLLIQKSFSSSENDTPTPPAIREYLHEFVFFWPFLIYEGLSIDTPFDPC
jgi:hypothetical protein